METVKISPEAAFILNIEIKRVQKELDALMQIADKGEYVKTGEKSELKNATDRMVSAAKKIVESENY